MELDGDEEQSVQEAYTPDSQCFGCGARASHLTLYFCQSRRDKPITLCFAATCTLRTSSWGRCRQPAAPPVQRCMLL